METERDVLNSIINDDPKGISGLLQRHGALFYEGLVRFYGNADPDKKDLLIRVIETMAADLRGGKFNDLIETFYDWVVKVAWCTFISMKLEESGEEDHLDPELIYTCCDPLNMAALPRELREECESHFKTCELCRSLLEKSKEIPVESRHAGAPYPEKFQSVITKVISSL